MSQLGHLRKSAFAIGMSDVPSGTGIVRTSAQVRLMPIVAKVFLWWRTKLLRAADASYARRREGPYRFTKNRSRTSGVALKSDPAAEKSQDRLSRDFWGCSIFDFCNNICQTRKLLAYSITRSAITKRLDGISIPNALAVWRFINSWNFVGCSIGRSAGFAPLKILLTKTAAVRKTSS